MENIDEVLNLIDLCDELMSTKILFADKKIEKILEAIATSPQVYELLSECMGQFNKEKEFDKAFAKDSSGKKVFVMPKEEYKILALVFCLLNDIANGKIAFDELIATYFADENGKLDASGFMNSVVKPFRDLIADAFQVAQPEEEQEELPLTPEQLQDLSPEERLKILPFPIERTYNFANDSQNSCQTFVDAKDAAIQMLELLSEERATKQVEDVTLMLHCIIISCMEKDFDLVNGLVSGLKYAAKGIKSLKYFVRELQEIVDRQIRRETRQ